MQTNPITIINSCFFSYGFCIEHFRQTPRILVACQETTHHHSHEIRIIIEYSNKLRYILLIWYENDEISNFNTFVYTLVNYLINDCIHPYMSFGPFFFFLIGYHVIYIQSPNSVTMEAFNFLIDVSK